LAIYSKNNDHEGLKEVACQMLLDEEEVIVLEVAERDKMIAQ